MAIRWSALQLATSLDEVEALVSQAEPFIAEAKQKANEARAIPNLPQYMNSSLVRLIYSIERIKAVRLDIDSVRRDIPADALELERSTQNQAKLL
jgi:hypothetical protein